MKTRIFHLRRVLEFVMSVELIMDPGVSKFIRL